MMSQDVLAAPDARKIRARRLGVLALGGAVAAVVALLWGAIQQRAQRATDGSAPLLELHVPHAADPIRIDAEMDGKHVWESESGSTHNFKDETGKGMVPYTEAKARWGSDHLYLWLYAGDLDLEGNVKEPDTDLSGDDSFHIELGSGERIHAFDVSVLGTLSDALCTSRSRGPSDARNAGNRHCDRSWQSHAVVAVDTDGTLNHIHDNDEEWIVEMAIPLDALDLPGAAPGARIPMSVSRCEVGANGVHACGGWGTGALVLDP